MRNLNHLLNCIQQVWILILRADVHLSQTSVSMVNGGVKSLHSHFNRNPKLPNASIRSFTDLGCNDLDTLQWLWCTKTKSTVSVPRACKSTLALCLWLQHYKWLPKLVSQNHLLLLQTRIIFKQMKLALETKLADSQHTPDKSSSSGLFKLKGSNNWDDGTHHFVQGNQVNFLDPISCLVELSHFTFFGGNKVLVMVSEADCPLKKITRCWPAGNNPLKMRPLLFSRDQPRCSAGWNDLPSPNSRFHAWEPKNPSVLDISLFTSNLSFFSRIFST